MENKRKELEQMLKNWKNLSLKNDKFEKDYFIDEDDVVVLMIYISLEKQLLYKTLMAKCSLDEQKIANAIDMLDEYKDRLI